MGEGVGEAPPAISMTKMFEESKWYGLLAVNAMLPFILVTAFS